MRIRVRTDATLAVMAGLLLASGFGPATGAPQRDQTVVGEIQVHARDHRQEVTSLAILDETWGLVGVEMKGKGRELLDQIGRVVEASGAISSGTHRDSVDYRIRIRKYRILESQP